VKQVGVEHAKVAVLSKSKYYIIDLITSAHELTRGIACCQNWSM